MFLRFKKGATPPDKNNPKIIYSDSLKRDPARWLATAEDQGYEWRSLPESFNYLAKTAHGHDSENILDDLEHGYNARFFKEGAKSAQYFLIEERAVLHHIIKNQKLEPDHQKQANYFKHLACILMVPIVTATIHVVVSIALSAAL